MGFAAETNNIHEFAKKKLNQKYCDFIVANDVSNKKIGFNSNYNEIHIISKSGKTSKKYKNTKSYVANYIVEKIINNFINEIY